MLITPPNFFSLSSSLVREHLCSTGNDAQLKGSKTALSVSENGKHRAIWVDVAKVIATLLIVVYHMPVSSFTKLACPEVLRELMSATCMPTSALFVFFILSGYFSPPSMGSEKMLMRIIALMIPYFAWNSLYAIVDGQAFSIARVYGLGINGCIDYPLWYLFAISCLILLVGILRKYSWILIVVSGVFLVLGNSWCCKLETVLPIASPFYTFTFTLGCMLSKLSTKQLGNCFVYGLPIWISGIILMENEWARSICFPCAFFSFCVLSERCFYREACMVASLSQASFLCFAMHAAVIVGVGKALRLVNDSLLSNSFIYVSLPFVIYGASFMVCSLMKRYAPAFLPVLAYSGRLEFVRRLVQKVMRSR